MPRKQYGQSVEVSVEPGVPVDPVLLREARSYLLTDLGRWAQTVLGHIEKVRLLESEEMWRDIYDEYDEDGEGIGEPVATMWYIALAWKAEVVTE